MNFNLNMISNNGIYPNGWQGLIMVEEKYYLNLIKENLFLVTMIRYDFETQISLKWYYVLSFFFVKHYR